MTSWVRATHSHGALPKKLSLSLFVLRIFANYGNSAFSFNTFAFVANFLYWWSYFHFVFLYISLYVRFSSYFSLKVILPLVRSYGVISTFTLSPGNILIKFFLIFPEICANISWSFSSFTLNIALGIDSIIVPSNSITSFAIFSSFSAL